MAKFIPNINIDTEKAADAMRKLADAMKALNNSYHMREEYARAQANTRRGFQSGGFHTDPFHTDHVNRWTGYNEVSPIRRILIAWKKTHELRVISFNLKQAYQ